MSWERKGMRLNEVRDFFGGKIWDQKLYEVKLQMIWKDGYEIKKVIFELRYMKINEIRDNLRGEIWHKMWDLIEKIVVKWD